MSYQTSVNRASHQNYLFSAKSLKFILFLGVYVRMCLRTYVCMSQDTGFRRMFVRMCVFARVFGDLHTYVSPCSCVHASIVE